MADSGRLFVVLLVQVLCIQSCEAYTYTYSWWSMWYFWVIMFGILACCCGAGGSYYRRRMMMRQNAGLRHGQVITTHPTQMNYSGYGGTYPTGPAPPPPGFMPPGGHVGAGVGGTYPPQANPGFTGAPGYPIQPPAAPGYTEPPMYSQLTGPPPGNPAGKDFPPPPAYSEVCGPGSEPDKRSGGAQM